MLSLMKFLINFFNIVKFLTFSSNNTDDKKPEAIIQKVNCLI